MSSLTEKEFCKTLDRVAEYIYNSGKSSVTVGGITFTGFAPDTMITIKRKANG